MIEFSLKLLFQIVGIGSASGLFYEQPVLYVISDNGGYLYAYDTQSAQLSHTKLIEGEILENIPKKQKPDFESLAQHQGKVYVFGSGSTPMRNSLATIDLKTKTQTLTDLTPLYTQMRTVSGISPEEFNIEGAVKNDQTWYLFQRGNSGAAPNGIFVSTGPVEKPTSIEYNPISLPEISGVQTSFTDAVLVGEELYFLAPAEDTKSTYNDGKVLGSFVGRIDVKSLTLFSLVKISDAQKFEGITFSHSDDRFLYFLLCEDNDTEILESKIYELELPKLSKFPHSEKK